MSRKHRRHADDLRGVTRLAIDSTHGISELVEAIQVASASGPALLGRPLEGPAKLVTGVVHGTVRGVTRIVGELLDRTLAGLAPVLGSSAPGAEREAVLGVLNGVVGDHLHARANPLAIEMRFRIGGEPLDLEPEALRAAFPAASSKLVVLVHGSCATDLLWLRGGHDHGAALARDLGVTPVYLHYNSGLHISTNGQQLADLLDQLVAAWPVPVEQLVLLGHSMGGLVARSACHAAEATNRPWRSRLSSLVTLGSPHHGAPLERGGSWVQQLLGISRFSAPFGRLARLRSAGITDLRFGSILDEHWAGRDRFAIGDDPRAPLPLPAGVRCHALAATQSTEHGARMRGDGIVPVDSALGVHPDPTRTLALPPEHRAIALGTRHMDLLAAPVYETLRAWLA